MAGYLLVVNLIILPSTLLSQNSETDYILQAKQAIFSLDTGMASQMLQTELKHNPDNGFVYYYQNYLHFLQTLLSGGMQEYTEYSEYAENRLKSLKILDDKNPEYLYFLSAVYLQTSLLDFFNGESWHGAKNFYMAHRHIHENNLIYPEYPANQKILGIIELLLSSIPSDKEWLFDILGMKGDRDAGIEKLQEYSDNCNPEDRPEALLIFTLASNHFAADPSLAFSEISETVSSSSASPLYQYVYALSANNAGKQDEAFNMLSSRETDRNIYQIPFADLLLAEILISRLDEQASVYYDRFISEYRGTNLKKMAYHKLSWHYFLNGDDRLYQEKKSLAQTDGNTFLEQDKQALAEAMDTFRLNHVLLRARLFYDGAHFSEALEVLLKISDADLVTVKDQIEYAYRLARVYHALEDISPAKKNYMVALDKGAAFPFYFAPYSALKLAEIYESERDFIHAGKYYLTCLDLNRHQYTRSIGSEARAGIKRVRDYSNE
ncbi:MAG: hypothetical protein ISS19_05760 [Bacteroidales bacterium]|nr:hypothetical protein [Bacteroidales bacterium]